MSFSFKVTTNESSFVSSQVLQKPISNTSKINDINVEKILL